MEPLRVGGLFSGIGGWELGLERAGMEVAWHCEADPFCRRVLDRHWPSVPCFEDVTTLRNPPHVDVLAGGFPCQDISVAGKGAGLEGARSGLWSEFARLIGEVGPRYVLVENVSALLGRGLGTVLADLSALGYDAEWDCLPASAFGAPHRRDRVWIVAYPDGELLREQPVRERRGEGAAVTGRDGSSRPVADAPSDGPGQGWSGRSSGDGADGQDVPSQRVADAYRDEYEGPSHEVGWSSGSELWRTWATEPNVGRVADGVPARVDRLRSLGNALVPQVAEWVGRRIVAYEESACAP